jgi:diacylglycerol O-acyltransferase
MQQLSPQDASFVYMESNETPMQIGGLYLYDPSTAPNGEPTEAKFLAFYDERLHQAPMLRQKLVRVPFDADYPYWIEDASFDLEYHIRRIALPKPADWDTLHTITARIFARPLDMNRPLWEVYVIEGLDNLSGVPKGAYAVLTKMHHSIVDGASGMQMIELLHDLSPTPAKVVPPAKPWRGQVPPNDYELMARSGINHAMNPWRFAETLSKQLRTSPQEIRNTIDSLAGLQKTGISAIPKTRFNGEVTPQRVVGSTNFDLNQVRKMRKVVEGATVNDAVLCICGGGIGRYLSAKNELDGDSLVAMAPVNLRTAGESADGGNQVAAMFVPIGTQIADPIERLASITQATRASKAVTNAIGARAMTDYSKFVPAFTAAMGARLMSSMAAEAQPAFNVSITNVPGPQVPLYSMGSKLITSAGLGPISQGMGLIMPITSYCGELNVAFTACRSMIPDPDFFVHCLEDAFEEFAEAALS